MMLMVLSMYQRSVCCEEELPFLVEQGGGGPLFVIARVVFLLVERA
jgi:hypothetical protein